MARSRRNNNRNRPNLNKRKENNRRTSNPQNEQEEVEAIQNDLDSEVQAMVRQLYLEKALDRKNMEKVMGIGGDKDNLSFFEGSFKKGYTDITDKHENYPYGFQEDEVPDIKRISKLVNVGNSEGEEITETQPDSTPRNIKR